MLHTLRRVAAATCAGLAVLFALETVTAHIATVPVVVATRHIAHGSTIGLSDMAIRYFPPSAASDSMLSSVDDVVGHIAHIDITVGDPILAHMARTAPVVPEGTTVIEVRLTSSVDELLAGDTVQLVSALGCETDAAGTNEDDDSNADHAHCVLADAALVMGINKTADTSYTDGRQLVSFAMDPDAAARVMRHQESGPIMAVMQ
ncbi:SAF domain-containing protein [Bifidobacterium felsineum]|uniref:SAF domain-containing protein n=1 Tax=Bifidobacterium felsineum TaxID=2045440 RepID=UPI001BDCE50B|nr:SAF domain-containing protein [Bifidobacterium felsineum]MBT1163499.1 flagella basal body P-ring formation protein FlgA [Bifidobacterium felsineum]